MTMRKSMIHGSWSTVRSRSDSRGNPRSRTLGAGLRRPRVVLAALLAVAVFSAAGADAGGMTLKMGSLAPEGTPWHQMLLKMGEEWSKISNGEIQLRIYPGGILGDEPDMIKKMRIGQLQMVGIATQGMSLIDRSMLCLQVPLAFESYEEFDYVRERIQPKIEEKFRKKGFIVLCWPDGGWIYFFTKERVSTWEELKKQKLFVWAGDNLSMDLYTAAGFRPVALAATDMLPSLQTGMINAFDTPALVALSNQWFGIANHMIDVKWAAMLGGIVMSERAWKKISADQRVKIIESARKANTEYSSDVRRMGPESIVAMQKRGLEVVRVSEAERSRWAAGTQACYPMARKEFGGPELFDEVFRLRDEFRARGKR